MAGSIMLIVLVIAMIVFMLLGSRKQKKMMEQRYSMLSELLPGDEVSHYCRCIWHCSKSF